MVRGAGSAAAGGEERTFIASNVSKPSWYCRSLRLIADTIVDAGPPTPAFEPTRFWKSMTLEE